jgi:uncharacterized membrane protein
MMRSKSTTVLVALLFVGLLSGVALTRAASSASPRTGRIKGVLFDVNKARVVNAIVDVEGGYLKRRVLSDTEGRFEVSLPPGNYQITVKANGFQQFTSPAIRVAPGKSQILNVQLVVESPRGLVPALVGHALSVSF